MITHTIDSYSIPNQNMPKSNLQMLKMCQKSKCWNFEKKKKIIYTTHFLKMLDKICDV